MRCGGNDDDLASTSTWVALLRGINVGGHNKLPMAELRSLLERLGATHVQTYIQSGNAAFRHDTGTAAELAAAVTDAIDTARGFRPLVVVLSLDAYDAALSANPFPEAEDDPKSVHLYFLTQTPEAPDLARLEQVAADDERFALDDTVLYLHAPRGIGRSKLATQVEPALGVPATARNWRSAIRIRALVREVRSR